ncbi:MAG: GEVED domain-containing protein [Anaerolineae bacterium]
MAAQQAGGAENSSCEDINPCLIYGVKVVNFGTDTRLDSINVCNPQIPVTTIATFPGQQFNMVAAARGQNALWLAAFGAGVNFLFPLPAGPLQRMGSIVPGAMAYTEGPGATRYAGTDFNPIGNLDAPPKGWLYSPSNSVGSGPARYIWFESDLVFHHGSDTALPLFGSGFLAAGAPMPNGSTNPASRNVIFRVSRTTGRQLYHQTSNFNFSGLAISGSGDMYAVQEPSTGNWLYKITGTFSQTPNYFPLGPLGLSLFDDLASTPSCGNDGVPVSTDLGDAPTSDNHANVPMLTYSGTTAHFPTVYDVLPGHVVGPKHFGNGEDSMLGAAFSREADADVLPDADSLTNIEASTQQSNRDGGDDGLPGTTQLANCGNTQLTTTATIGGTDALYRYVNAWIDFNRDGDWGDVFTCVEPGTGLLRSVNEWAVGNHQVLLNTGVHSLTLPTFVSVDPGAAMWMRLSVAEELAPGADGRGLVGGYELGETEDYLLQPMGGGSYSTQP